MKKTIYSIFLFSMLFLGINSVYAEEKQLTCVYGETVQFQVNESNVTSSYSLNSNAIFKEISVNNFQITKDDQLILSCPVKIYMRQVPYLQDSSMPLYISFDKDALGGSVSQTVELDANKSTSNIVLGIADSSNFKECIYKSDGIDSGIDVYIKYYNGNVTVDAGEFPFYGQLNANDFQQDGRLVCPDYNVYCTHVDYSGLKQCNIVPADSKHPASNKKDPLSGDQIANGKYLTYLGQLKVPLMQSPKYDNIKNISIKIDNNQSITLNKIDTYYGSNYLCLTSDCGGPEYIENAILKGTRNIASYCDSIYKAYGENKAKYKDEAEQCSGFGEFYKEMISSGVIDEDLNCSLLSNDMVDKLQWVLNMFRIIAPIAAIGLGTVDFIKVIASGDADKEMKNAGKRFLHRLIAAVLLLIIPTILAFLLDIFLGNSDGYDPDNPFCNIVEWRK